MNPYKVPWISMQIHHVVNIWFAPSTGRRNCSWLQQSKSVCSLLIFVIAFYLPFANAQSDDTSASETFSDNLFTDLTPLLALFGEEVTKQFLSQSTGWADDVILAMCPLGIITILISAIRAAGGRRLKALIGRARETRGTVEAELLSSTSPEVCELYGAEGIVRIAGSPSIGQYLYDSTAGEIFDLEGPEGEKRFAKKTTEHDKRIGISVTKRIRKLTTDIESLWKRDLHLPEIKDLRKDENIIKTPPNLLLN